jgi:hypothetical protein
MTKAAVWPLSYETRFKFASITAMPWPNNVLYKGMIAQIPPKDQTDDQAVD